VHAQANDTVQLASSSDGAKKKAPRPPGERPLPAFEGLTLSGTRLSISSLIGKRLLLYFFNPEVDEAIPVTRAVIEIAKLARRNNFKVVGIGVGSSRSQLLRFNQSMSLNFPVIDDSDATISSQLRVPGRVFILGVDTEGYFSFVHPGFDTEPPDAEETIEAALRESLRLPSASAASAGALVDYPVAPSFEAKDLDGKPFSLDEISGKPAVLIFFLHTCPHCHHALAFLKEQLPKIPEAERPVLIAVSLQNRPSAIRIALADEGLDHFPVLLDPDEKIAQKYGLKGGVPDISLIDKKGRIVYRMQGWRDDRDPALVRMYLAKISNQNVPFLLSRKGYSGNDTCAVCHETESATWEFTEHASAYDTLVTHGDERDSECVSCHVVGFDEPGGYTFAKPESHLENVGCENCHGRGGPHLSPDFVQKEVGYAGVCLTCHDTKHSLGFDYASFVPGVSHAVIASLSSEERATRFSGKRRPRALLPGNASFVGSNACGSCHTAEFETWGTSPHAHALASLVGQKQSNDAACLLCHTTGYGRDGGLSEGADANTHPDLARVGCESCHGPGSDHIAEGAKRIGSILSLGDKCDSCVILQICGTCHDEANDPDFEFEVEPHIERQRHGTIEPGTGKPLGTSASRTNRRDVEARVAEIFDMLDAG
jgi:peroxiredoxin